MTASAESLPKLYDPTAAQKRWLEVWSQRRYYHSEPDNRTPYVIVIPPPNVTGALHMGHALNNTIQDVLIRYHRMKGFNTLWMPGTDHAGIATQAVVEKRIIVEEKKTRHDLGREELVRRIWSWKDQYEQRILGQLRELGCSCDWDRTRFTLDDVCSKAVRKTFFSMFRDGYIYRGKRLVNWDTHLQTAVADDEIHHVGVLGSFWTFRYPVEGTTDQFIRFSTTRPETMLGDTAVAVHPNDVRYKHFIGRSVIIPLNGRRIPVIADGQLVDPKLGTGAVKVTPAHDPNDYQCGLRHKLPMINILNPDGTLNSQGGAYAGLTFEEARPKVVAAMEALGLLESVVERAIELAHSDRSNTPIQPYLSDQWFVHMGDRDDGKPGLGQLAIDAVNDGRVKFFPERYARTYLDWLGEKRDWCISRQLYWGHRIPIWYTHAAEEKLTAAFAGRDDVVWRRSETGDGFLVCSTHDFVGDELGPDCPMTRDEDVLDTWFSSALWPHSTLGWPEATPELRYYYPTDTLVTSRDIITLWVARMVLTGLYNVGEVPFREVYITPKLLDGFGETMSKSKGNGVDPLDIIARYGADALRFQMTSLAGETQDSRMPVSNVCPHCDELIPVKHEHLGMRTRKLRCPSCLKPFRPGGPWPSEDPELPTAKQASDKFEQGRNFANKLWNASRFLMLNLDGYTPGELNTELLQVEDRWILSKLASVTASITEQIDTYRFSEMSRTIYDFSWNSFCDWYIEMCKERLKDAASRPAVQRVLTTVLDGILRLVQPVMPFLAESVWHELAHFAPVRGLPTPRLATESVVIADWPTWPSEWRDVDTERRIRLMQDVVRTVREVRNGYSLDPKTMVEVMVRCEPRIARELEELQSFIRPLAGIGTIQFGPDVPVPKQKAIIINPDFEAYVPLAGLIDLKAEIKRLDKLIANKRKLLQNAEAKLVNEKFLANAPPDIVQLQRDIIYTLTKQIEVLELSYKDLGRD